ncbi:MAG TPA: aminotransferase class I/II-fold pyridoxal phosphate-dependent enzyme [Fimbriimonadaceae bacterium]|nr:aminotransferase class I/II-fold pyridoxal phosphate-dependent enzyme [Fimbriimonadaceae bacterium]
MGPRATDVVLSIPESVPFVGPESLERQLGRQFELRLGANESLFGASPMATEAMKRAADHSFLYGDPDGFELRYAIASLHNCQIENVILGGGIDELLMLFARAYLGPGDTAATTRGSYPTFEYAVHSVGGHLSFAEYLDERVNLEELRELSKASKIVYIANPDNPSGTWQPLDDFEISPDSLLILDEAYSDFAPSAPVRIKPGRVQLRTFSKGFGMAGVRIGYAICESKVVSLLNKIRMHFGVGIIPQAGALAALQDIRFVRDVVQQTTEVKDWLATAIQGVRPSHTNFVLIDLESREAAERMLLELRGLGVFVRKPGQPPLERYIRVSVGPRPAMELFVEKFSAALLAIG